MYLECTCADITATQWDKLMRGARKASYKRLVAKIRREMPELYKALSLDLNNPWADNCAQTKTHYILVWSATEYFIRKN